MSDTFQIFSKLTDHTTSWLKRLSNNNMSVLRWVPHDPHFDPRDWVNQRALVWLLLVWWLIAAWPWLHTGGFPRCTTVVNLGLPQLTARPLTSHRLYFSKFATYFLKAQRRTSHSGYPREHLGSGKSERKGGIGLVMWYTLVTSGNNQIQQPRTAGLHYTA